MDNDLEQLAVARVAEVAATLGSSLTELARALHDELAASIPELQGDPAILELLRASTESNVETFLHVAQHVVPIEDVNPPTAAVEYARRLAQRGTSSNALLRAYRLGQRRVLALALEEIAREEPDGQVAFAAAARVQAVSFDYVDKVSEHVVAEYEVERERWLANRNTVRASMLAGVLRGDEVDLGAAEGALGYRLRQHHLGVVVWDAEPGSAARDLRRLEDLLGHVAEALGAKGSPLFLPQDRSIGWGWIPLGRATTPCDMAVLAPVVTGVGASLRLATGTPAPAVEGFRGSHIEARRAHHVAMIAGPDALPVTSFAEPGVRAAALLAGDMEATRDLVASALGGLVGTDENTARLRATLLTFLSEKGSYLATAERVHLHKNTVKYRVDKAIEIRGRTLDDDRFNLELALLAAHWLGRAVLSPT